MLYTLSTSIIFSILSFYYFYWLLPILILNWWFMTSDTIKIQSWSGYRRNLTGHIAEKTFSKIFHTDSISFEIILIIFGKFGHLKDGSNPQESVNLQSIKNRIRNMIFSRYAQDSGNVTFWRLTLISKWEVSSTLPYFQLHFWEVFKINDFS